MKVVINHVLQYFFYFCDIILINADYFLKKNVNEKPIASDKVFSFN